MTRGGAGNRARAFAVLPPAPLTTRSIWVLCVAFPLLLVVALFGIMAAAPPGANGLEAGEPEPGTLVTLGLVAAAGVPVALLLRWMLGRFAVTFDGERLQVHAGWHELQVPVSELDLAQARILDLDQHKPLRPAYRTRAVGLPGLRAGHYRLRGWRRRAFVLLTSMRRVLVLPRRDGHVLMLSLVQPQALLDALRRAAP